MHRRLTTFLLMLCMCWQSLAYAGVEVLVAEDEALAHAMLHFEGAAHHHDGHDGGVHQDESPASTTHAMQDACVYAPALLIDMALPLLSVGAAPPADACSAEPPPPFLSGPERPPKALT